MKTFYRITGLICAGYGIVTLGILGMGGVFNFFVLAAGLFLMALSLLWDRMPVTLKRGVTALTVVLGMMFLIIEGIIIHDAVECNAVDLSAYDVCTAVLDVSYRRELRLIDNISFKVDHAEQVLIQLRLPFVGDILSRIRRDESDCSTGYGIRLG